MYIPNKKYYDDLKKEIHLKELEVDRLCELAEKWKHIYEVSKRYHGVIPRIVCKWALKKNQKYYEEGMTLAMNQFGILGFEIGELMAYINSFKHLEDKAV